MTELRTQTLVSIHGQIAERRVSSVEVTQALLE
jgi:hypothetical protein